MSRVRHHVVAAFEECLDHSSAEGVLRISGLFSEKFGASPKRYGYSLVFSAYTGPDTIDSERLTNDVNKLISEYEAQIGYGATALIVISEYGSTRRIPGCSI